MPATLHVTPPLRIVATYYVKSRGEDPFYEIQAAKNLAPRTKALVFLTRDEALYDQAVLCEDSGALVTLEWRDGTRVRRIGTHRERDQTIAIQVLARITPSFGEVR